MNHFMPELLESYNGIIFFVVWYFPAEEIVATIFFSGNMIIPFKHVDEICLVWIFHMEA